MDDIAISLKKVSKKYTIGNEKDGSLRGTIAQLFSKKSVTNTEFWALKDISFDVKKGEVIGIIGKNGAGKSTLLKILSKITRPTEGRIEISGRVASLLEVGTGFHPELTGRENIFLNGTILGMTKKEVRSKFDEIVAFSGIKKFIDTPVKHYSSGMYVRLAFAVAAHLEPEILIIDEVLAVGDAEFQKKCLGKMKDVASEGRTVLFVSHDLTAIKSLCDKSILLDRGNVVTIDSTYKTIETYLSRQQTFSKQAISEREDRNGIGDVIISDFLIVDKEGNICTSILTGSKLKAIIKIQNQKGIFIKDIRIDLGLNDPLDNRISWFSSSLDDNIYVESYNSEYEVFFEINSFSLMPGNYSFTINLLVNNEPQDWMPNIIFFDVIEAPFFKSPRLLPEGQGIFLLKHAFKLLKNVREN